MYHARMSRVFALASLAVSPALAEWTQVLTRENTHSAKIFDFAVLGGMVFGGFEFGVYGTSDQGGHWTHLNAGMDSAAAVFSFATDGPTLYAGTVGAGVFRSGDLGASWTSAGLLGEYVSALAANDGMLYAGTCCSGLWISADGGAHWKAAGIGSRSVSPIHAEGGTVFAGFSDGLYRSFDHGGTWERLQFGPGTEDSSAGSFIASKGILYAGTGGGLYRSLDTGDTWTRTGLPPYVGTVALAAEGGRVFAGVWEGVFQSFDSGATWERVDTNLMRPGISCLAISNGDVFAGVPSRGVWRRPLSEMGPTALSHQAGRAVGPRPRGKAFPDGNGIGFATGSGEARRLRRDARGRKAVLLP